MGAGASRDARIPVHSVHSGTTDTPHCVCCRWDVETLRGLLWHTIEQSGVRTIDLVRAWDKSGDDAINEDEFVRAIQGFFDGAGSAIWHRELKWVARKAFTAVIGHVPHQHASEAMRKAGVVRAFAHDAPGRIQCAVRLSSGCIVRWYRWAWPPSSDGCTRPRPRPSTPRSSTRRSSRARCGPSRRRAGSPRRGATGPPPPDAPSRRCLSASLSEARGPRAKAPQHLPGAFVLRVAPLTASLRARQARGRCS